MRAPQIRLGDTHHCSIVIHRRAPAYAKRQSYTLQSKRADIKVPIKDEQVNGKQRVFRYVCSVPRACLVVRVFRLYSPLRHGGLSSAPR